MKDAFDKHPDARVLVNFASYRAAYDVTMEAITMKDESGKKPRLDAVAIIAEGIPERFARRIMFMAHKLNVVIIGPATVSSNQSNQCDLEIG